MCWGSGRTGIHLWSRNSGYCCHPTRNRRQVWAECYLQHLVEVGSLSPLRPALTGTLPHWPTFGFSSEEEDMMVSLPGKASPLSRDASMSSTRSPLPPTNEGANCTPLSRDPTAESRQNANTSGQETATAIQCEKTNRSLVGLWRRQWLILRGNGMVVFTDLRALTSDNQMIIRGKIFIIKKIKNK